MATISRLDQSALSTLPGPVGRQHFLAASRVFRLLGITPAELDGDTVSVKAKALRLLLSELARHQPFDPEFYADTYPDIEAARMAGQVSDLHEHFIESGFIEGRLPSEPPFDPVWYARYYPDLANSIAANDVGALRNHFLSAGIVEGRAGTGSGLNAPGSRQLD